MGAVSFSRFGLWGFDLCEVQIMQNAIEVMSRGIINATEKALTQMAEVLVSRKKILC